MASKSTKTEVTACSASLWGGKVNVKGPTLTRKKETLSHRAQDSAIRRENIEQRSRIGAVGGAAAGAAIGAAAGSVVPALGTAAGAILGTFLGFGAGYAAGGQSAANEPLLPSRRRTWRCCCCCFCSTED